MLSEQSSSLKRGVWNGKESVRRFFGVGGRMTQVNAAKGLSAQPSEIE
jgi:hypothetical protein